MEVYGGQAKTPNLNTLATEGLKFTRCFQTAPMCSPTRHNIYTGLYPVKSGAWPNHTRVYPGTKSIAQHPERLQRLIKAYTSDRTPNPKTPLPLYDK